MEIFNYILLGLYILAEIGLVAIISIVFRFKDDVKVLPRLIKQLPFIVAIGGALGFLSWLEYPKCVEGHCVTTRQLLNPSLFVLLCIVVCVVLFVMVVAAIFLNIGLAIKARREQSRTRITIKHIDEDWKTFYSIKPTPHTQSTVKSSNSSKPKASLELMGNLELRNSDSVEKKAELAKERSIVSKTPAGRDTFDVKTLPTIAIAGSASSFAEDSTRPVKNLAYTKSLSSEAKEKLRDDMKYKLIKLDTETKDDPFVKYRPETGVLGEKDQSSSRYQKPKNSVKQRLRAELERELATLTGESESITTTRTQ